MTCYSPVKLTKTKRKGFLKEPLFVPCARCLGCLLRRNRDWTVRCSHEFAMHEDAMFITLTYTDENLRMLYEWPDRQSMPSLFKPDLQNFLKRYRKYLWKQHKKRITFFAAGEYGKRTQRPHYHAIIFGHVFSDLIFHSNRNGNDLYESKTLTDLWGLGDVIVGDVTPQSIAYTARYCIDKLHQRVSDPEYSLTNRIPEFVTMSNRPAIGKTFYDKFYKQFLSKDAIKLTPDFSSSLPRYYNKLYSRYFSYLDSNDFIFTPHSILDVTTLTLNYSPEVIKARRVLAAALKFDDSLPDRLASREHIARTRLLQAPSRLL